MDTQGPILASFSNPSTNSAMILKICQESFTLISCHVLFSKARKILSSRVLAITAFLIFAKVLIFTQRPQRRFAFTLRPQRNGLGALCVKSLRVLCVQYAICRTLRLPDFPTQKCIFVP